MTRITTLASLALLALIGVADPGQAQSRSCNGISIQPHCTCYQGRIFIPVGEANSLTCISYPVMATRRLYVVTTHWQGDFTGAYNVIGIQVKERPQGRNAVVGVKHDERPWSEASTDAQRFIPGQTRFRGRGRSVAVAQAGGDMTVFQHRFWSGGGSGCMYVSIREIDPLILGRKSVGDTMLKDVLPRLAIEALIQDMMGIKPDQSNASRLYDLALDTILSLAKHQLLGGSERAMWIELMSKQAMDHILASVQLNPNERRLLGSIVAGYVGALANEIYATYEGDPSRELAGRSDVPVECRPGFGPSSSHDHSSARG